MTDQIMIALLKETAEEIDKIIKKEEEIEHENKVREDLSNPKSQEDYMKNMEILRLKLRTLLSEIDKILSDSSFHL